MIKKIAILGSTGSIGKSTLDVIKKIKKFLIILLSANSNYQIINHQIKCSDQNILLLMISILTES